MISLVLRHDRWLLALSGIAAFAASFCFLTIFGSGRLVAAVLGMPQTALAACLAVLAAQLAMSLTNVVLTRHLREKNKQMRTALDSMAQGLCMFDGAERLVVCNSKYSQMYGLTPDEVTPGTTLSEVLTRRIAKGTFSRDPEKYRREFVTAMGQGRTTEHEVKSSGGRTLLVMNHPMKGGGWIGTHEDITERKQSEEQRTTIQQQEHHRARVDSAISAFRTRAENLLQTVTERAGEMRETAVTLYRTFGKTSKSAQGAVQMSGEASSNMDSAAFSAEEMARSIAEIEARVTQTADVVRLAVGEAHATNQDIGVLFEAAQKIDDVIKLIGNIAGQTNLLALNATIEAARAGEAGRGFAVVASEVKSLAVQTSKATGDIASQILEVQNSTNQGVQAIGRIVNRMKEIDNYTVAIATSVQQQNSATGAISQNVNSAAEGAKLIASVLSEVAGANTESQQAAQRVLTASEAVEEAAAGMRGEVENFLTKVAV